MNFFPAVLVGGPPHAGKSVLLYRLTQALRARSIDHYPLRACPDGEGNWFQESDPSFVSTILVKHHSWPVSFVNRLPEATPLSVYGIGPSWLYAALAAYSDPQPFYLFDPRLPFGWPRPVSVKLGEEPAQTSEIVLATKETPGYTVLSIHFPHDRLAYFQLEPLAFPVVPPGNGVIIDGRVPNWLLAALVHLYKAAGVAWIAPLHVQAQKAVIVFRVSSRSGLVNVLIRQSTEKRRTSLLYHRKISKYEV